MKKIVVPTDFSPCAENAVNFAVQTAKLLPVDVILLSTYEISGNIYTDYMGANKDFNQSMIDNAYQQLMDRKAEILKTDGVDVKAIFYRGNLQDGIDETIVKEKADIIVMGTTGASGLDAKIWGSKTATVIGHSKIPVLAIPKDYTWKKPGRLLIVTNHFEKEAAILDPVFEMANLFMADIHAVVFSDTDDDLPEKMIEHGRKIREYKEFLKKQYHESSLQAGNLFDTEFETAIAGYAEENKVDIIVMITYQRSFWDRIFHPSITKRMSYHTHIPLLAIPVSKK